MVCKAEQTKNKHLTQWNALCCTSALRRIVVEKSKIQQLPHYSNKNSIKLLDRLRRFPSHSLDQYHTVLSLIDSYFSLIHH